jgi:glycerophosphoryl diester phosphodiesterase
VQSFPGNTVGEQLAEAASSINADILSPVDTASQDVEDPTQAGYVPFTTKEMVDRAHKLDLQVKPWTVNRMSVAENLIGFGVDGIITDYPANMRRLVESKGLPVASTHSQQKILKCLEQHIQTVN